MSGSIADYDRLCEALDAYEAGATFLQIRALAKASRQCGRPKGVSPFEWSRRRVSTYRAHIAQVSGLVEHMNNVIQQEMSK